MATTEICTLSLPAALPIWRQQLDHALDVAVDRGLHHLLDRLVGAARAVVRDRLRRPLQLGLQQRVVRDRRSEEHTSELQSRQYLVCRLLLEKKKTKDSPLP